ncbi:MAG: DMT family transporter [Mariprofundaceae bacterium]|nr:DMT family transporter [Mariprofundaceae bacterium]
MSVSMAYVGVIIIWSTTPLAIAWSNEGVGFIFGVTSRMVIGAMLALIMAALLGFGMKWHRRAVLAYAISGLGMYGAMFSIYWSAQYIPSGWISVIFGLSPVVTAIMAGFWLDGEGLTRHRMAGMFAGLAGLAVIFSTSLNLDDRAAFGVAGVLLSVFIHSAITVWIKRIDAGVPTIVMTSGGLVIAAPLFLMTWLFTHEAMPSDMSSRTVGAIAYLALFGSVLGFSLYFYVLRHVEATRVALITLIAPVSALLLGHLLNGEPLTMQVMLGSALILSGLALFELGDRPGRA